MADRRIVRNFNSNGRDSNSSDTFLYMFGNPHDEIVGKLKIGSTMLNITEALNDVKSENSEETLFSYTIALYIAHDIFNIAVQFIEIKSNLLKSEIITIIFKKLDYCLPGEERIDRRQYRNGEFLCQKYFGYDSDFFWLVISQGHAYIHIGNFDGIHYQNNFKDYLNFIFRSDPENIPELCTML